MTMGGMVVMASGPYSSVVLLLQLITITETGALSQHRCTISQWDLYSMPSNSSSMNGTGTRGRAKDWHSSE
jgi:hypothetical protein